MKNVFLLGVGWVLVGCSTMSTGEQVWFKEGGTPQERDRLLLAAEVQARQAYPDSPMAGGAVGTTGPQSVAALQHSRRDVVVRSMTAQGWRLVPRNQAR